MKLTDYERERLAHLQTQGTLLHLMRERALADIRARLGIEGDFGWDNDGNVTVNAPEPAG